MLIAPLCRSREARRVLQDTYKSGAIAFGENAMLLTEEDVKRFVDKVPVADDLFACQEWMGNRNNKGYGRIGISGKSQQAHRVAWTIMYGDIPDGLCVCHRCDNPICVNVNHLFLGTVMDNTQDMIAKGRDYQSRITHCPQGHPYVGDNLYINTRTNKRDCNACKRNDNRKFYMKNKEFVLAKNREYYRKNRDVINTKQKVKRALKKLLSISNKEER